MARKILLADDSVTAQNMGRKILADAGYDIVTVNNGSAALKRIAEVKPDLIVLDVYMPGYSGLEVCQRLKDSPETEHIPVLLTVGKLEPFKPEEARRVRADAHIVKPFEASELLTAITRLEDRMVPQQASGGGRRAEGGDDADTGWKNRLRFPAKKKKDEPETDLEPEESTMGASFRDFRKGKVKTGAGPTPPGQTLARAQEPLPVPDIPRDITPEELDALSAVAAKLDAPAAAKVTSSVDKIGPVVPPKTEVAASAEPAKANTTIAATTEVAKEVAKEAAKNEPEAVRSAGPVAAIAEAKPFAVEAFGGVEIPVEHLEVGHESAVESRDQAKPDTHRQENQHSQPEAPAVTVAATAAHLAQPPAPVDRTDEPIFAAAEVAQDNAQDKIEAETAIAAAEKSKNNNKDPEKEPEKEKEKAEAIGLKVEEPGPSHEELAEALRLLTPATGNPDVSTVPSRGTLVAAGQMLAEEAARHATFAPRWVAEAVALSPEEATVSLEAEMFRTFAATPAAQPSPTPKAEFESGGGTVVSALTAAVESRLAVAELAATSTAEQARDAGSADAETLPAELAAVELSTETSLTEGPDGTLSAASNAADSVEDAVKPQPVEPGYPGEEKIGTQPKYPSPEVAEETPTDDGATATFADAGSRGSDAAEDLETGESATTPEMVATVEQHSSSEAGGEDMSKGESNGRQIHTAPAGAAASHDAAELTKPGEHPVEQAPKAMAAAAAEGSPVASATEASAIASIVDSVMADLRPKIVEEIAKKLAGK